MAAKELLASSSDCITFLPNTVGSNTKQIVVGGNPLSSKVYSQDLFPESSGPTLSSHALSRKSFTFDYVFDTTSQQSDVYQESVSPLLNKFLEGFNATILAYGQVLHFDVIKV